MMCVNTPSLTAQALSIFPRTELYVPDADVRSPTMFGLMIKCLNPGDAGSGLIPASALYIHALISPNMMWLREPPPSQASHKVVAQPHHVRGYKCVDVQSAGWNQPG